MESRSEKIKDNAYLDKLAAVHEHLLPRVIDLDMIYRHVYQQGPTGEAGRVAKEEGINLDDVKELRLEYLSKPIIYLNIIPLQMLMILPKIHISLSLF